MIPSLQKLIGPFTQIVPMAGLSLHGPLRDEQLRVISNGGVVLNGGMIVEVGPFEELHQNYPLAGIETIDRSAVLLPGFIDAHTHICFAGTRAQDYDLKLQGKTYLEIARQGGGIKRTVAHTREASEDQLVKGLVQRANRHFEEGVTTIEVKSGYGLSVEHELKMLRAIRQASKQTKAAIVPTCLAAHTIPLEFDGKGREYLEYLVDELLPILRSEGLAERVDIFIEDTAFKEEEARWYLLKAGYMGFSFTVHADQFTPGGAKLAVEMGALSADHLEASGEDDISVLAQSKTVAVVLPGASLGLGIGFAPARKLLDAGCCMAIASDWNPGSAPMGDLLLQASLLGVYQKLSFTETMAGLTFRAAHALGLGDRGLLEAGKLAHMVAFPTSDYREILYQQGKMKPFAVWA